MENEYAHEENRQWKLKQQDGRKRNPVEQQQVEQRIESYFVEPRQFEQEQFQPKPLGIHFCWLSARADPPGAFLFVRLRLSPTLASH